ncbi:MAG TPA: hypothetical protein VGL72_15445, partial [Bryobacteraceae bacterium]|jgi:hypothetical protein
MRRLLVPLLLPSSLAAQQGWWMTEPIRWVQTNLRQTDAALDTRRLANQLAGMRANVLLFGMGGIAAYYPTKVAFHYPSPDLPPGRDMFGDELRECHARNIRVVGRFDFSKTRKAVFDAHPEWFFRQSNGEPVIYNGLYSTCINGGYYRQQALKILTEALENYDVDGLFFNMFGNQSRDYSGHEVGLCHCESCRRRYADMFHKPLPDRPDDDYRRFMFVCSREVAASIGDLIHRLRPHAGYFNYIQESTDGIMSESNTAIDRPLPLWPYSASDNVNRARNSEPGKMAVNLNMQFVDYAWRFATVPSREIALRMWQNMAQGGALTFEVNGTLDQQDRQALDTARPIFQWAAANQQYYAGEESDARVLLLGAPAASGRAISQASYRGLFRLLTEEHVPFAVSDNLDWIGKRTFDLVIASDWAPAPLQKYVEAGGRLLIASPREPEMPVARVLSPAHEVKGYLRVRNHSLFPSLQDTDLLLLDGHYTEVEGDGAQSLSLVPPSMIGPPEFIHIDMHDTDKPGIIFKAMGPGQIAWLPWDLGGLYYRTSLPAHAALFRDVINRLNPTRQLVTNAHPLVEIAWMRQGNRRLLHLINLSGHSQTGYFTPVQMAGIRFDVAGKFETARTIRTPRTLPLQTHAGRAIFTVPALDDYELVVLE